MMAKNELVSLGLIYPEPRHAYAINAIIRELGIEQWAHISQASIYNTLNRLKKEGCVDVTREKVGKMPERKVYSITDTGRQRLNYELEKAILATDMDDNRFYLAMSFAFALTAEEAIKLLNVRIETFRGILVHLEKQIEHVREHNAYNAIITISAGAKHIKTEIETAQEFIHLFQTHPDYYTTAMADMFRVILKE
jgi:DNA-binding PadR family transcriptional regulator